VMDRPDWVADGADYQTHLGRGTHQAELDDEIGQWTVARTAAELLDALSAAGVPAGRIYTARDIAADPHYAARGMIVEVPEPGLDGDTVAMPGIVPKLSGSPGVLTRGGPLLGEHNDEILGGLLSADELDEMRVMGAA
jgi:crotonobetainyl-CoA:carnitine CoA-transferase CaiB-like acyl-CoA transferase